MSGTSGSSGTSGTSCQCDRPWSTISGGTYDITTDDDTKWLRVTNAVGCTISFDDTKYTFTDGEEYIITQYGAGQVTIDNGAGTINVLSPTGNVTTRAQYSTIFAKYYSTQVALILGGDLT